MRGDALFGYGMILPSLLIVMLFTAGPILASIGLSFYQWDVIDPPSFVGVDNYTQLAADQTVIHSFGVTIGLAVSIVVLEILIGLGLALLVQQRRNMLLRSTFRTVFYLPLLASASSVAIVMGYMFDQRFGVVNYYLGLLGIPNIPWLTSDFGATSTIVIIAVWQQVGFAFVLFVAALGAVSKDVLEAAAIDGAGPWSTFFSVKLPMISPSLFFVSVVGLIGAMQLFDQPYVMTKGGPGYTTTTTVLLIYQTAFQNLQFGYGSAISVVLLLVLIALTGLQFLGARKLVFYQ
jgi:multiple sugar transport system permease protein